LPATPSISSRRYSSCGDGWRIEHTVLDIRNFPEPGHQGSSGLLFHVSGPTRLITVIVIDEYGFDVGHLEAEAFDVVLYGLRQTLRHRHPS